MTLTTQQEQVLRELTPAKLQQLFALVGRVQTLEDAPKGMYSVLDDKAPMAGGKLNMNAHDIHRIRQVDFDAEIDWGNSGSAFTINWNDGNNQALELSANCTITFVDPPFPCHLQLKITQDGTGSRTITWSTTGDVYAPGGDDSLTGTADSIDFITIWWDGTDYWIAIIPDFQTV